MSSFGIESAGKWLGTLLVQEVKYLSKVKGKVEDLQSELEWMQCFLLDADEKQDKNALIRKWVSEITDLAHEAEDLIETYILNVSFKRQGGVVNSLKWLACFWMDAKTVHIVGSKIDGLTSRISKLSSRLQTYGVRNSYDVQSSKTASAKKLLDEQRRSYSLDHHDYIGDLVAEDVTKLVHQLQTGSEKIVVAHAMGGMAKTARAKQVYRKCLSEGHFVGGAWTYVSEHFDPKAIFKNLLNDLIPNDDSEKSSINDLETSKLSAKLYEILKRKRYLIVLDDVWTFSDWKRLESAFPINETSCNSRILVTTLNPHLLSKLGKDLVFTWEVGALKEDSCWKLLENKGHFKKSELDPSMQDLAKKMLDHCNGHPRAIVALGTILATKNKSRVEWESVCENLQSYLQGDDESYRGVYDALAMSYHDLHYNLKPCFLHMAHFPEKRSINVEKLYSLWIADGIVSSTQDRMRKKRLLEEVADDYLNQLVQKGMVQVNNTDVDGRIATCRLHELMRDKCLEMTIEENFLQIVNIDENKKTLANNFTDRTRRVTLYVGKEINGQSILDSLLSQKIPSLRSLVFISTCKEEDRKEESCEWVKIICKRFKLLRVLDFEGGVILRGTLPRKVGNLIYLRHLCLRGTRITKLPSSIRNLKSLLIFDIRVSKVIIKLPNVLWEMSSLCYLYFPSRILSEESAQGYETEDGTVLILNQLNHLERVDDVNLDEVDVNGLLKLRSMKKLSATCKRNKEGLVSVLRSSSIKYLNLKLDANLLKEDYNMLSESSSLRILHIDAERYPPTYIPIQVDMFPCDLVELGFWYCLFKDDPMPVLEKLPKLRNLELYKCYNGRVMNCSSQAFPELNYLALNGLSKLERWNVQGGGFAKLQELEIYRCPLEDIPATLPPKVSIKCSDDVQTLVDKFRCQQVKVPKDT